ncbi:HAD family hydrolase [Salmonella enterica subsp. enterica]|nr:HAD family hydrolase [Salmonella enterica subsp. enterica]
MSRGNNGGHFPADVEQNVETWRVWARDAAGGRGGARVLVLSPSRISLKAALKRFAQLRRWALNGDDRTKDNRLTRRQRLRREAHCGRCCSEATPETKLALIRQYQAEGRLVAMTGDGITMPALAQADVAVAMNSGGRQKKPVIWWICGL